MPPAFQILEPSPTRNLREYGRIFNSHQRLQCGYRSDHHSPTNAIDLGATDGHTEKDRTHNQLCSWLRVSTSVYASEILQPNLYSHSVCVAALVRLIMFAQVDSDDYTRGILKVVIVTAMEPLLGIIAACLPLFRPAMREVTSRMRKIEPETHNVLSSSMVHLHQKRPKGTAFQHLDDSLVIDLEDQ